MLSCFIWLLLCYAQYVRSNSAQDYEEFSDMIPQPQDEHLPIGLGRDNNTGCICRARDNHQMVECYGLECIKFPKATKIKYRSDGLRVRTTAIETIHKGDLDAYYYLKMLEIESNYKLQHVEPGVFMNLTNLEQLYISTACLQTGFHKDTFQGLINLRNLTLVKIGIKSIQDLSPAFKPTILPSLRGLDLSENIFEIIPDNAFLSMQGTTLQRLDICFSKVAYIHPKSLLVFKNLNYLNIGGNDLNATTIGEVISAMINARINLTYLNLSEMGFRNQPSKELMNIISRSTVKRLNLAGNQFEIIDDDIFPVMKNIELIDLNNVHANKIGEFTFNPAKFPNLKVLLLRGNSLSGIHKTPLSGQLIRLDLSANKGSLATSFFDIIKDTFINSTKLRNLNIGNNNIKFIHNETFRGLYNLKVLNMGNGCLYKIGDGSFKQLKKLETLNLTNNPLVDTENLTYAQFQGLNNLKILLLTNCGLRIISDDDNIFEAMPNLTNLILNNNLLQYITAETIKPLKLLRVLDLSRNLLASWINPLFISSGVRPLQIYLTNNKISFFSIGMIQDINYLLENRSSVLKIDFTDNIFTCDCTMYKTYLWLQDKGTGNLKRFFNTSKFQCSISDVGLQKQVDDYIWSRKTLNCEKNENHLIPNLMVLIWTAPLLVTVALLLVIVFMIYKYRMYIRYWMFLAKIALGRSVKKSNINHKKVESKRYKYDAFVSYCSEDREFVLMLVAQLENQPPYLQMCVYERDFEIGSVISDAVQKCINESKYIVLIISNSFAKSQWCRWETQLAEYHRIFLDDGTSYDPLVLIRVGEVHNKYLTMTLKYLLKTKIYHDWDENNQDEFWRKLRNVLIKNN